jgi:ABC-type sulfate/molybdate transport systems ATPase subunit
MSLADRIVIINRGKIEQIGTRLKCIRKVPRSLLPPSSGLLQPISSRR